MERFNRPLTFGEGVALGVVLTIGSIINLAAFVWAVREWWA